VFLDAGEATRFRMAEPSAVIVEGSRYFTTDPEYPGGHLTEADPALLVPWSPDTQRDLKKIALAAIESRLRRHQIDQWRIERSAEAIGERLARRCTGAEGSSTFYDVGQCAQGKQPVPCTFAAADDSWTVVEVPRFASDPRRRWTRRWLVAETEGNRSLLAEFADRVRMASEHADNVAARAASSFADDLVRVFIAERGFPNVIDAARE